MIENWRTSLRFMAHLRSAIRVVARGRRGRRVIHDAELVFPRIDVPSRFRKRDSRLIREVARNRARDHRVVAGAHEHGRSQPIIGICLGEVALVDDLRRQVLKIWL